MRNAHLNAQRALVCALMLFMLAMGGCAMLGATPPKTTAQGLYTADAQFSALTQTATDLMNQGVLTGSAAKKTNKYIHEGDNALSAAWKTVQSGGTPNPSTLSTVSTVSGEINAILQQYAAKKVKSHG